MLFKKKVKEPTANDKELERLYGVLAKLDPEDSEYAKVLTYIGRLHQYGTDTSPEKVKKDTWITAGANLLGIGLIVGAESVGSRLLSKNAFGFIPRK